MSHSRSMYIVFGYIRSPPHTAHRLRIRPPRGSVPPHWRAMLRDNRSRARNTRAISLKVRSDVDFRAYSLVTRRMSANVPDLGTVAPLVETAGAAPPYQRSHAAPRDGL